MLKAVFEWFESNPVAATVAIALVAAFPPLLSLAISVWRYVSEYRSRTRHQRFENYHKLVSELVEGREDQEVQRLDSQIAVVFELRNYSEYREVSQRILEGLRKRWADDPNNERLVAEIDYTLAKLQERRFSRNKQE